MNDQRLNNLAILSVRRFRGKLLVSEFVDLTTGEILDPQTVERMGLKSIRPDARIRREEKLKSLRKEVRPFAIFLLRFRNKLGGFLIDLDQLIRWYAKLEGKEPKHVRRHLPRLVDAGILDFDHKLNPDFMWFNTELGKADVRGEVFTAHRIFDDLMLRKRDAGSEESCSSNSARLVA